MFAQMRKSFFLCILSFLAGSEYVEVLKSFTSSGDIADEIADETRRRRRRHQDQGPNNAVGFKLTIYYICEHIFIAKHLHPTFPVKIASL